MFWCNADDVLSYSSDSWDCVFLYCGWVCGYPWPEGSNALTIKPTKAFYCLQQTGESSCQQLLRLSLMSEDHVFHCHQNNGLKLKRVISPVPRPRERDKCEFTDTDCSRHTVLFLALCFQTTNTVNYPSCYTVTLCNLTQIIWQRPCSSIIPCKGFSSSKLFSPHSYIAVVFLSTVGTQCCLSLLRGVLQSLMNGSVMCTESLSMWSAINCTVLSLVPFLIIFLWETHLRQHLTYKPAEPHSL